MKTFLTSTCHRNYKKCVQIAGMNYCGHLMKDCYETKEFILPEPISKMKPAEKEPVRFDKEENHVNLTRCKKKKFYDQKVCRHLCSKTLLLTSTRTKSISPCESMCFELTRSSESAGEVCPTEKYCPYGCPCPFYECEKLDSYQKLAPVFDLQKPKPYKTDRIWISDSVITGRWHDRKAEKMTFPIVLSSLENRNKKIRVNDTDSFLPYERFYFLSSLLASQYSFFVKTHKSTGATFLNGEHYLVDVIGNLMRVKEDGTAPIVTVNRSKNMLVEKLLISVWGSG